MSTPTTLFRIENGVFALDLVDTAAVGYDPAWQAPTGKTLPTAALADYTDAATAGWSCQIVSGVVESAENITTTTIDPPICADTPPAPIVTQSEDTFTVVLDFYQDPTQVDGLSAYLFQHRGKLAFLYYGQGGDQTPPVVIGVVRLTTASLGGGRTPNRATPTFTFDKPPDIQFGNASAWIVVPGDKSAPTTGPGAPLAAATGEPAGDLVDA